MPSVQPDGYVSLPASGKGSPVLVLHPWWGLNQDIRSFCDRLAESGFVVFAPDLYHGKVTDQIAEAQTLTTALSEKGEQVSADLTEAVNFLKARAGSESARIAVIGFSMGAYYALLLSITAPEAIRSVVVFYGTGPEDFSNSQSNYLGHFAELDEFEPQESVIALEESLKRAGRPVTLYQYAGTGHWFFEPNRIQAYHPAAAALAWDRTVAFLNQSFQG
ncbi:carboxymethylenebutenolidase [Anaerolineae bacterium]|nr:carboxymethylenebutenolidase [Anaerolineae bacterium]